MFYFNRTWTMEQLFHSQSDLNRKRELRCRKFINSEICRLRISFVEQAGKCNHICVIIIIIIIRYNYLARESVNVARFLRREIWYRTEISLIMCNIIYIHISTYLSDCINYFARDNRNNTANYIPAIFFTLLWHVSRKRHTNARFNIAFRDERILLNEKRETASKAFFQNLPFRRRSHPKCTNTIFTPSWHATYSVQLRAFSVPTLVHFLPYSGHTTTNRSSLSRSH